MNEGWLGAVERIGLIGDSLKKLIRSVPKGLLTAIVIFADVSGGFSANLMIGSTDALLTGITESRQLLG